MTMLSDGERLNLKTLAYERARRIGVAIPAGVHVYTRQNGHVVGIPFVGSPMRTLISRLQAKAGLTVNGTFDAPTRAWLGYAPPPPEHAYGVDISNNNVVYPKALVAGGQHFVWHKATQGLQFIDKWYDPRRTSLEGKLLWGAYHFAEPSAQPGDGIRQASHFLAVAKPRPGDLLPVLDLEINDLRISPTQLASWTREFLHRVVLECGGCMIYTYPAFWSGDMAGNPSFGAWPLWIAHYGVARPEIPRGWSEYAVWQFTSTGSVPGIPGHADRNVTPNLDAVRIKASA